jgi:Cu/Ag efflux pump CusA
MLGSGAGFETRRVVGVVIVFGVSISTVVTLALVPLMYALLARRTGTPQDTSRRLQAALEKAP